MILERHVAALNTYIVRGVRLCNGSRYDFIVNVINVEMLYLVFIVVSFIGI
ncbi:hypothetical protein Hanom_Chr16g01502891 [Helianthus anomalus]